MNHIICLILLACLTLGGCRETPVESQKPNPVDLLQGQIESERQGRLEAEKAVAEKEEHRRRWELATVGLALLAVAGFLAGTILGSRGRRHAEANTI
ncbi:MAG: hypothetical protein ABL994_18340 [Verrucomicrobiales bacterium]